MQTEFIINLNALPALLWMLDNQKKNIRKEACWTISNITAGHLTLPYPTYYSNRLFSLAGTSGQIQAVINAGVFPKLIALLQSSEFDIQKEAAWAVSNATSGGQSLHSSPHYIKGKIIGPYWALCRHPGADPVPGAAGGHPAAVQPAVAARRQGDHGGAGGAGEHPEGGADGQRHRPHRADRHRLRRHPLHRRQVLSRPPKLPIN